MTHWQSARIRVHALIEEDDYVILTGEHTVDAIWDGVASDRHDPCEALSVNSGRRCPKASAVVVFVTSGAGGDVGLCGGHYGVHRAGKRVVLPERRLP